MMAKVEHHPLYGGIPIKLENYNAEDVDKYGKTIFPE